MLKFQNLCAVPVSYAPPPDRGFICAVPVCKWIGPLRASLQSPPTVAIGVGVASVAGDGRTKPRGCRDRGRGEAWACKR